MKLGDIGLQSKAIKEGEPDCLFPCTHHKRRNFFSHMVFFSHLPLILACVWWVLGKNEGPFLSHVVDKGIAILLTVSVGLSLLYHYYYECIVCTFEEQANIFGVIMLNIYLWFRGVSYKYIGLGFIILAALQASLEFCRLGNSREKFEIYHPYCHYVAAVYVFYCVYLIQLSFKTTAPSFIPSLSSFIPSLTSTSTSTSTSASTSSPKTE